VGIALALALLADATRAPADPGADPHARTASAADRDAGQRADADPALARLRAAVARHPDDPDLAWALARGLAEAGRTAEARGRLARDVRRWPERPDAHLLLGTLLADAGRDAEAVRHLERAAALDPESGTARFRLALALRRLGRGAEAEPLLREAGAREPALRGETLLLRGIGRLERGDERRGEALLREAIALDPDSDAARAAQVLLRTGAPEAGRFALEAWAGMEYDSNVVLDSGAIPGASVDRDDGVGVWGAAFRVDVLRGERRGLALGAGFDERNHLDLEAYDEKNLTGSFATLLHAGPRTRWRLAGAVVHSLLDDESYLSRGLLRPSLTAILGERSGVARLVGHVEGLFYEDDPVFASAERDGLAFGAGLSHHVPIPGWPDAWGTWRFDYLRYETRAGTDALGFRGAYDHDRYQGGLEARLPLPWQVDVSTGVFLAGEVYHHDNVVDYLAQLAQGGTTQTAERRRRRDLALETRVELVRPLSSHLDLALHWRFLDRGSNTDFYAYDRHFVGFQLRMQTF